MLKKLSGLLDFSLNTKEAYSKKEASGHRHAEAFDFLSLIKNWEEIAGKKLAEHSIPLKNQNGTLIILSNHSAFAHQISLMELPLKKKIFSKFPTLEKHITNIKFIVDSTHFDKQKTIYETVAKKAKPIENTLHPYSPEFIRLKKEATALYQDIEDEEMRNLFISMHIQAKAK